MLRSQTGAVALVAAASPCGERIVLNETEREEDEHETNNDDGCHCDDNSIIYDVRLGGVAGEVPLGQCGREVLCDAGQDTDRID